MPLKWVMVLFQVLEMILEEDLQQGDEAWESVLLVMEMIL